MSFLNWGIIGCGDVTEVKSGPAFQKIEHTCLKAVMRRDGEKAKDYAARHGVEKWYDIANALINDADINAIYIATPPSSHEAYAIAAMQAGKPVYVEKPMTLDARSAAWMQQFAQANKQKLVVAHYRRALPYFLKVKALLDEGAIGDIRFVRLTFSAPALSTEELQDPKKAWRINPAESGGGLFRDLSPHQLDIMYYLFGEIASVHGYAINQAQQTNADDLVSGQILFASGVLFQGLWCFNAAPGQEQDVCEIVGSKGTISFGFFGKNEIVLTRGGEEEKFVIESPMHIQQPMIEKVVDYFLDRGPNPCSAEDGVVVMDIIDQMTGKY
jgi:predicted dehydrogenase